MIATKWETIASALTEDVRSRKPGDRLPTEAALSERFGVNRHTVRHALDRLREMGLIYVMRGAGYFVADPPGSLALRTPAEAIEAAATMAERHEASVAAKAIRLLHAQIEAPQ